MNILGFIGNIFKPATDLVDNLHTSNEERLKLQGQLQQIENQLAEKVIDYESKLMRAQADIITAEAKGASWMQRNWRPVSMLTFLVLVVFDAFGLLVFRLSAEAWTLLQVGLGGYVIGRSAEKTVAEVIKTRKD